MAFGIPGGLAGLGAGTIGAVQVVLDADSSRLKAGLTQAQKQTAAATTAMEKRASNMKAAWAAAAVIAGAALIKLGISSVRAFQESERANNRLQNTLKNNPKLAGESAKAFTDQAAALQDLTGVSDEAVIGAQAVLGQFDLTGDAVRRLTPLVVDLSEKMGIDLEAAAKAVGKATQGSGGILARYGIKLDEIALKTNAVKETTEGLTRTVGGFAAKQGKTMEVRLRILAQNFNDLQERIGKFLVSGLEKALPVLEFFMNLLSGLFTIVGKVVHAIEEAPLALKLLAAAAIAAVSPIAGMTVAIISLHDAWRDLAGELSGQIVNQLDPKFWKVLGDAVVASMNDFDKATIQAGKGIAVWRGRTIEGVDAVKDVFDKLAEKAHLTAGEVIKAFNRQNRAIREYEGNWERVNRRGLPEELRKQLQSMGLKGAEILDVLADANDKSFERIIRSILRAMGHTKEYIDRLLAIPKTVTTRFVVTGGTGELNPRPGPPGGSSGPPGTKGAALGYHGMVNRPTWFLTGEAGSERVDISPAAQFARAGAVRQMALAPASGGGGTTKVLNINFYGNVYGTADFDRHVEQALTRSASRFAGV